MSTLRLGLLTAALLAASSGCRSAESERPPAVPASQGTARPPGAGVRRTLIRRAPAHEPGWETRLYLIEYPPGVVAPLHVHPVLGVGWVVEGAFESAFGDEPVVEVRAGEGFIDQADVPHRVFRNASADHVLRFVVAYTIRATDEPVRTLP